LNISTSFFIIGQNKIECLSLAGFLWVVYCKPMRLDPIGVLHFISMLLALPTNVRLGIKKLLAVNVKKLVSSSLMVGKNKLECFYLASFPWVVYKQPIMLEHSGVPHSISMLLTLPTNVRLGVKNPYCEC